MIRIFHHSCFLLPTQCFLQLWTLQKNKSSLGQETLHFAHFTDNGTSKQEGCNVTFRIKRPLNCLFLLCTDFLTGSDFFFVTQPPEVPWNLRLAEISFASGESTDLFKPYQYVRESICLTNFLDHGCFATQNLVGDKNQFIMIVLQKKLSLLSDKADHEASLSASGL